MNICSTQVTNCLLFDTDWIKCKKLFKRGDSEHSNMKVISHGAYELKEV